MNAVETILANEWNHHDAYVAHPLSDYGDSAGDLTNGMSASHPRVSNRNEQGHLQDRATRLLMDKLAGTGRKFRE